MAGCYHHVIPEVSASLGRRPHDVFLVAPPAAVVDAWVAARVLHQHLLAVVLAQA